LTVKLPHPNIGNSYAPCNIWCGPSPVQFIVLLKITINLHNDGNAKKRANEYQSGY